MSNEKIEITDAMVDRAMFVLGDSLSFPKRSLVTNALRAALNEPPPALCTNCGKPKDEHTWSTHVLARQCPSSVWEPAS